jgi:hypothetical protein
LKNGQCAKSGINTFPLTVRNLSPGIVSVWLVWGGLESRLIVCEVATGESVLWVEPHHYDSVTFQCGEISIPLGSKYLEKGQTATITLSKNACN